MHYVDGKSETLTADVSKNAVIAVSFTYVSSVERPKVPENMVLVEGGTFQMGDTFGDGSTDEKPVHSVTVSSFYLGKYEVTQREWRDVMGTNPSTCRGDSLPVENVSWYKAVEFCNRLSAKDGLDPSYAISGTNVTYDFSKNGFRLPTEAEWEFAARGGNQSRGNECSGSNDRNEAGWYVGNAGGTTHQVGTKIPNEIGLYDMSGNVWEWCWDIYGAYSSSAQNDPTGASSGSRRVLRGGSWGGVGRGNFSLRSTERDNAYNPNGSSYGDVGFRVAVRPQPQKHNLALTATASASSELEEPNPGYPAPASKAIDGIKDSDSNRWVTNTKAREPHWIAVDLGGRKYVDTVKLYMFGTHTWSGKSWDCNWRDYTINVYGSTLRR